MTQMDLLVTNVTELLATAVHEVLRLMGQAVSESREESARLQQENQKLQRKLDELQEKLDISDAVQCEDAEESSFDADHEQALDCRLEPCVSEGVETEASDVQNLVFKEEKPSEIQLEPEQDVNTWHSKSRSPAKRRRPFSGLRKTTSNSSNNAAVPENTETETPRRVILHSIKEEPNPEPLECVIPGQSDSFMVDDAVFNMLNGTALEDGQNRQPYSTGLTEPAYILQEQYTSAHAHVLSSRAQNRLDVPNLSHLHMRRESAHICHICGKTFATSSSLGAHFVCHSNERPFACKCCNFRFSRIADLRKHERIHTGERPYNCSLCGRRFNRTENLRRHLRKVHHGAML